MSEEKTYAFTEYCSVVYKRFMKVCLVKLQRKCFSKLLKTYEDSPCDMATFKQIFVNNFFMNIYIDPEYDQEQGYIDDISYLSIRFCLSIKPCGKGFILDKEIARVVSGEELDVLDIEGLNTKIDSLVGLVFKKCKQAYCQELQSTEVDTEGWCERCYFFSHERGDVCPICMEDGGKWVKLLPCGHLIHESCWLRSKEATCPMCRGNIVEHERASF